jgi:BirA family biotin operon repressor/biotin-[acetyl-CoA-carboxylase] ligase
MIGKPYIILSTVDSTNNHAMRLIREGKAAQGMVIFALEQTEGKGQRGRSWQSESGKNIMMSTLIQGSRFSINEQFPLSASIALACYDFFSKYAGDETRIKWPNDLYWRDRKAGGVLIENTVKEGKLEWIVAGTGININQVDFSAAMHAKAVSLKQITGKEFDPFQLSKELLLCIEKRIDLLLANGAHQAISAYNDLLYKKGEEAMFRKNQIVYKAMVRQVNISGELEIEHGVQETIRHGEIEWVL